MLPLRSRSEGAVATVQLGGMDRPTLVWQRRGAKTGEQAAVRMVLSLR